MNPRLLACLCVVGALAFACGPRSRTAASPLAAAAETSALHIAVSAGPTTPNEQNVTAQFAVAANTGRVDFSLGVTNAGKKRVELDFPDGQTYDFVVVDSLGREVWRWGAGRLFTQSVRNKLLGQGESMHISEHWTVGKPGSYIAIATLRSSNFPVEHRVEFQVR